MSNSRTSLKVQVLQETVLLQHIKEEQEKILKERERKESALRF